MTESENIFNPIDGSLEARVEAYRRVHEAWLNAEASLKYLENDEWADTLGDREEVKKALDISINSLNIAANSFSKEDISEARERKLLSDDEAIELVHTKRKQEQKSSLHSERQDSDYSEFSRKQ